MNELEATNAFQDLAAQFSDGQRYSDDVLAIALETVGLPGDLTELLRDEIESLRCAA